MFFEKIGSLRYTLAFRLTIWYAAIFILSACIVFYLFYMAIHSVIRDRVDEQLRIQANEFAAIYALQGLKHLQRTALLQAQAAGEKKMFYRLFYPSGVVFSSSNLSYWKDVRISRQAVEAVLRGEKLVYTTRAVTDSAHQVRIVYTSLGASIVVQLGYSLEDEARILQAFKKIFATTMTGMLLFAVAAGWFMSRRALSGVASVTRTARRISESDLETRVPVGRRHDEVDKLAHTFNQMLDRIEKLVTGVKRMNDNIAHDLRSPITRIRGLAEVTLTGSPNLADYEAMAANTVEECDRLLSMINTMLTISKTEAGVDRESLRVIDYTSLVREACELFRPVAEDRGIALVNELADGVAVTGDAAMLQRMVANLIDNAVKYTHARGTIRVSLQQVDHMARLKVADTGIGISEQDRPRIFDRFFRGDQSRSMGGTGLGLSLVAAVIGAHDGHIHVDSTEGQGSAFTVDLPGAGGHSLQT